MRLISATLAAALLAASPAPAARPAGAVYAEIRHAGRLVWQGDLIFTLIGEGQMVAAQAEFPDPRRNVEKVGGQWSLSLVPPDAHEVGIPIAARYRRGRQEYSYSFGWSMPLAVAFDGSPGPSDRDHRIASYQEGYFFLGRHERRSIRFPDDLVVTFRR
jgi:hypothetical protein